MQWKATPCNARENKKKNEIPLINPTWRPRPNGYTPPKKHRQNQTYGYLVDVTSTDHGDRVLRPGPKQNLEKKAKRNFQGKFPGRSPAR
jgi:hypothetical protein